MKLAILGTGTVGRTLAAGFAAHGHDVVVGTRDPASTRSRPDWSVWPHGAEPPPLASYAQATRGAEVVVTAVAGNVAAEVLAGAGDLSGTVVLDPSNPLDFSRGFPPSLSVCNHDSVAEVLQRAYPETRVVKALNTVNAALMLDPGRLAGGDHTMFLAGDDADARAVVRRLLEEAGWTDLIEFDSLSAARGMEMWLPLWVRLMQQLGHADFNLKVVRP